MPFNLRRTLMAWGILPDSTPFVILQLDISALADLAGDGAVVMRAPRDGEGGTQLIGLLGPHADQDMARRLMEELKSAPADLPPLTRLL